MATKFPRGVIDCGPSPADTWPPPNSGGFIVGPTNSAGDLGYRVPNATMRTTGGVNCFAVNVAWNLIQPVPRQALVANNAIDRAIADCQSLNTADPDLNMNFHIRIFAGIRCPDQTKARGGTPITVFDTFDGKQGTVPRYWLAGVIADYLDLQQRLAAAYDTAPEVTGQTVSLCALFYPEQFIKSANATLDLSGTGPTTGDNMVAAGYTLALDQQTILLAHQQHDVWANTATIVAYNPASLINSNGGVAATDEAFTEQAMDAQVADLGDRAMVANFSLRLLNGQVGGPSPQTAYAAMYTHMRSLNVPIFLQTARKPRLCEYGQPESDPTGSCWPTVYSWATTTGEATAVETIAEFSADYDPATLGAFDAVMEGNPVVPEIALPSKDRTSPFRQFYPSWATGTADGNWIATDYDNLGTDWNIVIAHFQQFGGATATRSANLQRVKDAATAAGRDIVVGVYVNGTFVNRTSAPDTAQYPRTAFTRSSSATFPYLVDSGPTYLMNPFSYDWHHTNRSGGSGLSVPDEANSRRQLQTTSPDFDGWIVDNLGYGVVGSTYNTQAQGDTAPTTNATQESPPDPLLGGTFGTGTGAVHWTEGTRLIATSVAGKVGRSGNIVYAHYINGGSQGSRYFDATAPVSVLKNVCMLLMFESWVRAATDAVTSFKSEANWTSDLNAVLDLQRAGKGALLYVKVWDDAHAHTSRFSVSAVNTTTETITTSTTHGLAVNDRVIFSGSGSITNVTKSQAYYVQAVPSTTTFRIATTASAGAPMDLGALSGSVNVADLYDPGDDDADLASIVKIDRGVTASYLLVTNGRSFLHFRHDESGGVQRYRAHRWTTHIRNLGYYTETCTASIAADGSNGVATAYASGGLKQPDGTYRRLFDHGVVYVNPTTGNISVTAPYTGSDTLTDVDGSTFAGNASISIPANSARILVKS